MPGGMPAGRGAPGSGKSFYLIVGVALVAIVSLGGFGAMTLLGSGPSGIAAVDDLALAVNGSAPTREPVASGVATATSAPTAAQTVTPSPSPAPTETPAPYEPPPVKPGTLASSNWAGQVMLAKELHSIVGEWTQPVVDCTNGRPSHVSFWVGLDGAGSHTVEQIGTAAGCDAPSGFRTDHYAWWEMYPLPMKRITLAVHPGDHFKARVDATTATTFALTLDNVTTGQSFTTTASRTGRWPTSAEWIAEATSLCTHSMTSCTEEDLAKFGDITFTNLESDTAAGPVALEKAGRRKLLRVDIR